MLTSIESKKLLEKLLLSRQTGEMIINNFPKKQMRCPIHLGIGQEAIGVGVCQALRLKDYVFSHHRCHTHYLAKNGDLNRLVAELHGRSTGCAKGKGGSMHLVDRSVNFMGTTVMVGGAIPLAVGTAFAAKLRGDNDSIAVVFFGDGAIEEGIFYESANFALLHHLRVLFICENNQCASYTDISARQPANPITQRLASLIPCTAQDGNNVAQIYQDMKGRIAEMDGPLFCEFHTKRWSRHVGAEKYCQSAEEKMMLLKICPVEKFKKFILDNSLLLPEEILTLEKKVEQEIQLAFAKAQIDPFPNEQEITSHVWSIDNTASCKNRSGTLNFNRRITTKEAISEALTQVMSEDKNVFVIGEGTTDPKGVFGTTLEIAKKFPRRVFESPLAENAVTGICAGAALTNMRPIHIHQRVEFSLLAMDQIINHLAKWSYMFGGQAGKISLTIRMIIGRYFGQAAQQSQALQALFAHIPGLIVVMPSTPYNTKGLLRASIESNDPVIFIEHQSLYSESGLVPEETYTLPLGKAAIARPGTDLTIVSSSYMTVEAMRAAKELQKTGINTEVVDLRTVNPLDKDTILRSVKKTGRLLVADLAWYNCSVAATIAAMASEDAFSYLKAPIKIISLPPAPTPCSWPLEQAYYPTVKTIIREAAKLFGVPTEGNDSLIDVLPKLL
ncbi:MAG: thiamine pyrophosphate-dependent enzyme [Patescibacteria group bacterium]|jgi:2-oxoisovalerate dehydrogenase E1 component